MRRSAAPFGNDLQDDFDVKVVGGKIVHVSKYLPVVHSVSTDAHQKPSGSKDMGLKENVTASSSQNSPTSPKEILKLPPIQKATSRPHKNKFHSAPPKLHFPTGQLVIPPMSDAPTGGSDDALFRFKNQLTAVQRKRPHILEDIKRSCTRLDDLRNGTIPLQEVADVLYVNGISVSIGTLRDFVEYNKLTVNSDSNQILYEDFVDRIAEADHDTGNTSIACELKTGKSCSPFLHTHHKKEDAYDFIEGTHSSGLPSRLAMSCPEWQVTTTANMGSCDDSSIAVDDTAAATDDVSVLLSDMHSSFGGTCWGSHGDVQQLESALAKADKRNTGCLPAVVVCVRVRVWLYTVRAWV